MKLMLVTPYFYPKIGGLENYAYNFCIALKKKYKWQIVVVTSNHTSKKNKKEKINGLTIYRLASWFKVSNTPINPFWYFRIKKIIEKENPNIINAHSPVPFIADVAALCARNVPYILTYHAFSLYKYNFSIMNFIIGMYKFFEHKLFKKANAIIVVSNQVKATISPEFRSKTQVIYNSISSNEIPRMRKQKKTNKANIVFIGNLDKSHEWKGLNEILLAIKGLSMSNFNKVHLSVIGDGDNKHHYKKNAKKYGLTKNVTFFGKATGKKKFTILANSTAAIIYPKSTNDAFPTVALEYWAYRLPIIASNIIPINSLFKNMKTAYLVRPDSPNKLSKAIKKLTDNTTFARNLALGGYAELINKYLLENEVKKFNQLLKKHLL